jgi:hypothetical protein
MRRTRTFGGPVLLGLGLSVAACSGNDMGGNPPSPARPSEPSETTAAAQSAPIDVAPDSRVSLGLRGSLGPVIEGQTITKAMVTMQDVELVSASGAQVVLLHGSITTDLLVVQNDLRPLFADLAIEAGQFTAIRFRLTSAWIQTVDAQGVSHVFASEQADQSQFSSIQSVNQLVLGGFDPDGFVTIALPPDGIQVQGAAALALSFALSESLTVQSDTVWALTPRVWIVDQSIFSSVDVEFDATSESFGQFLSEGFRVMMLDADLRPIVETSLVVQSSTLFVASFRFVEFFQGPFTAVLVPPQGFSLSTAVAVSISVQQSVRFRTSISVTSVQQISGTSRGGALDVVTSGQASFTERSKRGEVIHQGMAPVGSIEQVAPPTLPREPLRPGEQPPGRLPPPHLPGLPAPGGMPAVRDAGGPPPVIDAGGPPPSRDAGGPPPIADAGGPPPIADAGGPPPIADAGGPPPIADAGGPPPRHDAGGPPPSHDAGRPAVTDGGTLPPSRDAGGPPPRDAGVPHPTTQPSNPAPQPTPSNPAPQPTPSTPAPQPTLEIPPVQAPAPAPPHGAMPQAPTPPPQTPSVPARGTRDGGR